MLRSITRLTASVAITLAFACSHAGAQASADYWPMKLGSTWKVSITAGDKKSSESVSVTKVKSINGEHEATIEYSLGGNVVMVEVYRRTASGLFRLKAGSGGAGAISPPFPQLLYPLKSGKKWSWKGSIDVAGTKIPAESVLTVDGPTAVKTPAGTFRALHIHSELVITVQGQPPRNVPNDYWFADGVGMVKQRLPTGSQVIEGVLESYKL